MRVRRWLWLLVAVVTVLVAVVGYRHFVLVEGLRRPLLEKMADPDSAKFRNERYFGNWTLFNGTLCGEVNAKNRMGGYTGYESFHVGHGTVILASELGADFVSTMCTQEDGKFKAPWWWLRW